MFSTAVFSPLSALIVWTFFRSTGMGKVARPCASICDVSDAAAFRTSCCSIHTCHTSVRTCRRSLRHRTNPGKTRQHAGMRGLCRSPLEPRNTRNNTFFQNKKQAYGKLWG